MKWRRPIFERSEPAVAFKAEAGIMSAQRAGEFFAWADHDPILKERVLAALSVEELLCVARSEGFVFELSDMALLAGGSNSAWLAASGCSAGGELLRYCYERLQDRSHGVLASEVRDSCRSVAVGLGGKMVSPGRSSS